MFPPMAARAPAAAVMAAALAVAQRTQVLTLARPAAAAAMPGGPGAATMARGETTTPFKTSQELAAAERDLCHRMGETAEPLLRSLPQEVEPEDRALLNTQEGAVEAAALAAVVKEVELQANQVAATGATAALVSA